MPFGALTLQPGVNVEKTPLALRTGISKSQFIRFRDQLVQKQGGWQRFYPFAVGGIPRNMTAWQDTGGNTYLGIGTTTKLAVITNNTLQDISPQIFVSNFAPYISVSAGSNVVNIIDTNINNPTVNDSVLFNTPVTQGGIILFGLYPITQVTGTNSYQIQAATNATTSETNPTFTNASTGAGSSVLHFLAVPAWVTIGMVVSDITVASIPANTVVTGTTGTTVTLNNNVTGSGVGNGDGILFSSIPEFTTINGSATVLVTLIGHGLSPSGTALFQIPTTGNGVTISGAYSALTVPSPNTFTISASTQATASGSFVMNGGQVQLIYKIAQGPPPLGLGYGLGGYGTGGYGTGSSVSNQTGPDIASASWTSGNWGSILLANPINDGIYYWQPGSGFQTASLISSAPVYNAGIFISNTEQIVIAYGSSVSVGLGVQQQPLLVQWSDVGNFFQWTVSSTTQAGNFTLPSGSKIVGGLAVANQNLLWTDTDLWAMNYVGPPNVFGFTKIGSGMGLSSPHAILQMRGAIAWMGPSNFFVYSGGVPNVIPCPVWDAVFQNLNTSYLSNICALPNTPFNEIGWAYPSSSSVSGENDSYVRMNILEPGAPWDYGAYNRSAWIDQSVLGNPIGTSSSGIVYLHEGSPDADGNPLISSFTTGDFYIDEGEQFVFIDQIMPDFKWGTFSGSPNAQVSLTFNVSNFPGDTPTQYGPYTVNQQTEYLSVRFRGRLVSVTVQSSDLGSFWRIGSIKFRFQPSGRR